MNNLMAVTFAIVLAWLGTANAADSAGAIYLESLACNSEQGTITAVATAGTTQSTTIPVQKDTHIRLASATDNFGAAEDIVVDRATTDLHRTLVQFDLSSIPTGATITGAFLKLQASSIGGSMQINAHQMLVSWEEMQATWVERSTGQAWTTPGGDFDNAVLTLVNTSNPGEHTFVITALAKDWFSGAVQNNGVMIASADGGTNRKATYDARETTSGVVPFLQVLYTAPAVPSGCVSLPTGEDLTITSYSASTGLFTATVNGTTVFIPQSAVALH